MEPNYKSISKFLSLVLRHQPEVIGLVLDENGWANTQELLQQLAKNSRKISLETLQLVVANNDKKRFIFSEDGQKIRANQGHSIEIDLGYKAVEPPTILFHGTATRFLDSIKEKGLVKGNRHHVHLSENLETATKVGSRHGKVVVIEVDAKKMHDAGLEFFVSDNGVWLTDHIPTAFLKITS